MSVRVRIETKQIKPKVKKAVEQAQRVVDSQVLKDSNRYAPMDTGNLINSSLRASQIGQGRLVWDTPYARRLYYNPQYNFSKARNPQAGGLWRSEEHTSELQSRPHLVCRLLLEKKNKHKNN